MSEKVLAGKTGLVFGVANKRSIAWAIAQAWHEAGGTQTATVTVTPGQSAPVSFTFKAS